MKLLIHPNVVDLRAYFYSSGDKVSFLPAHSSAIHGGGSQTIDTSHN
jgi:hypothetical protein